MAEYNFVCAHKSIGYCKRTLKKCSRECGSFGKCDECENYHIPHGQDPCRGCIFDAITKRSRGEGEEWE